VLHWAVEAARTCSAGVVLVLPAEGSADHDAAPDTHGADAVVAGGPTRADSVRCGLAAVPEEAEVIVVHDAARPLARPELFAAVIAAVTNGGVDGAVPGVRPSDTIKEVDAAGNVTSTLDRDALVAVQTPQAFRGDVLRRAHKNAGPGATDDAMLVEALGATVRVVPGDPGNLKITGPGDLDALERLLTSRGR
jgi:2-C-methyl-D-erythritol 4-phosphate cytidylyltransferase